MNSLNLSYAQCCGCSACYNICKFDAIDMIEDEKGFLIPKINKEKCVDCGACANVCPVLKNKLNIDENNEKYPLAYAMYNKNEDERLKSSSGGIFTLLAKNIINNKGIVYGASFNNENLVEHIRIDKLEDVSKLQGSKYMQSIIGKTYQLAEKDLKEGRTVLFTGTPCQTEALKSYLNCEYDNLYIQDIICHGVPSALVWKEYIKKYNDKKLNINFRNKEFGWKKYCVSIKGENVDYTKCYVEDTYMKAFLKNIVLRDCCYNCQFKKYRRISDITLADFWGIDKICPEMFDDRGTSLIIVNSSKGERILNCIIEQTKFKKVNLEDAIKMNRCMVESVAMNEKREEFFKELGKIPFDELIDKYI